MDRRDFLKMMGIRNSAVPGKGKHARSFFSGLEPYSGSWTLNEVSHLLKRTMFGAKKTDIDHFLSLSSDAAIDVLLDTIAVPLPPVRDYGLLEDDEGTLRDDLAVAVGQT